MTETGLRPLSFLLVSEGPTTSWLETLQQAVSTLGELETVAEGEAVEAVVETQWHLVVVDAGAVREFASLVSSLRANRADLRVAVFTSSPTWPDPAPRSPTMCGWWTPHQSNAGDCCTLCVSGVVVVMLWRR